ncbi:MAG: hypothetical protein U0667_11025 [Chloroflexota bacterium]
MIYRIALLVGGIAATAILAFGLLRGDRPALGAADQATSAAELASLPTAAPASEVVDVVYIAAPKKPKVVHVTRRAPTPTRRPSARHTQTRDQRRSADDEHEDREHERGEREGDD